MKPIQLLIAFCFAGAFTHAAERSFHFDAEKPGWPPSAWLSTQSGGGLAKWTVETESSSPSASQILKQSGNADFPVCLATNVFLTDGIKREVKGNRWHTLKLEAVGTTFKVWLNGEQLFAAEDKTFSEAGAVGLWTKADSETLFDDFKILSR